MFISQVIFESDIENREEIERIMNRKREEGKNVEGLLSHDCWWKESAKTVGFSIVTKWNDKELFKAWMKDTHAKGRKKSEINITKTAHRFKPVE